MNNGKTTICMLPRESLLHLDAVLGEDCCILRMKSLFVPVSGAPFLKDGYGHPQVDP